MEEDQKHKSGVIWGGSSYSRSLAVYSFDTACTTSYSPFIWTVHLSRTIFKM